MNSLQQIELAEVDALQAEEQPFEIIDMNGLNWAFRKISALRAQEKEITMLANVRTGTDYGMEAKRTKSHSQ